MTGYFLTSFWVITSEGLQYFMMVQSSSLISDFNVGNFSPSSDDCVIVLIIADWDRIMNYISDCVDELINKYE